MAFGFLKKNKEKKEPTGSHYHELVVKKIIPETKDTISIVFQQPSSGSITYKAGQFLTLIITIQGKEVRRAYSLCSSPFTDTDLIVGVKRVENGLVSNWLADHLQVGSTIKIMDPMGHFTTEFKQENRRHLVLFAGGSGITPMMSIIKSVLSQEPNSICSLIYCNRDIDSIIFKDSFDKLQTQHPEQLRIIHVLDNAPSNWEGYSGLLNKDMVEKLLHSLPAWGIDKTTYLMCGPEGMMKSVENLLIEQQIPANKIFKESFVASTADKPKKESQSTDQKAYSVLIRYDGNEYKIKVEHNRTILQTALDQGIDIPYSCQSGLCTACRGKAVSGRVKLDEEEGLSKSELAEGYVLTCVGHPLTDDVVIEIG